MATENEPEFDAPPSGEAAFDKEGEERTSDEIECPDWLWELEQQSRWEGHVRAAVPPAPAPPPARTAAPPRAAPGSHSFLRRGRPWKG